MYVYTQMHFARPMCQINIGVWLKIIKIIWEAIFSPVSICSFI